MCNGNLEISVMFTLRRGQVAALVIAMVLITMIAALPAAAQEDDDLMMVSGALDLTQAGDMFVAGYLIDLTGASLPPLLHDGDIVLVVGTLLADGETIHASSMEPFDDLDRNDDDVIGEGDDDDGDGVIDIGNDDNDDDEDEYDDFEDENGDDFEDEDSSDCDNPSHPIGTRLSEAFDVPYTTIMLMHCDGNGFGEITRAFLLAEAVLGEDADLTDAAQEYLNRHKQGEGWGNIVHEVGVHPSQLAPGHVIGHGHWDDDGDGRPGNANGNANGNSNGHGNGNHNGNGNGNHDGNGES
jgi:hypothetical protein